MNKINNKKLKTLYICIGGLIAVISIALCIILALSGTGNEPKNELPSGEEIDELEKVTFPSDSPKSLHFKQTAKGECFVWGIGDFCGDELEIPEKSPYGDVVVGIAAKAFLNCDFLLSVSIPETVSFIGERAFEGCSSLAYISVDISNQSYSSSGGILYTKNKTMLIRCPPARASTFYIVNSKVTEISEYAFAGVKNLERVMYRGSTSEFEAIKIGTGNKAFTSLPITCNYVGSK